MIKIKNRKLRHPKYFYFILFSLFLFLGVGYSVIHTNFNISGNIIASANSWNIIFDNIAYSDENYTTEEKVSITNGTQLNLNLELTNPGDKYEFTFDIKNQGTLDALIKTLSIDDITEEQKVYLEYIVEYTDESKLEVNDLIKQSESKTVRVLVRYKDLRATDLLPKEDVDLNLNILINFYYPQEENYELNLIQGTATNHYQVKNTQQEVSLSDITLSDTDTVIVCNNGAIPTTDDTGLITVKHIKQDSTCRIEKTLSSAVTNSNDDKTNITILSDATTTDKVEVQETQDISIDLNGKTYTFDSATDTDYGISNFGKLSIKSSKENGTLKSLDEFLLYNQLTGTLNISGGNYIRECSSGTGAVVSGGGIARLRNSSFKTPNNVLTIYTRISNAIFNIENCTIESESRIFGNWSYNCVANIRNSTIISKISSISLSNNDTNSHTYICNSKISNSENSKDFVNVNNKSYAFYSKNTIFNLGDNNPTLENSESINRVVRSDIACKE